MTRAPRAADDTNGGTGSTKSKKVWLTLSRLYGRAGDQPGVPPGLPVQVDGALSRPPRRPGRRRLLGRRRDRVRSWSSLRCISPPGGARWVGRGARAQTGSVWGPLPTRGRVRLALRSWLASVRRLWFATDDAVMLSARSPRRAAPSSAIPVTYVATIAKGHLS